MHFTIIRKVTTILPPVGVVENQFHFIFNLIKLPPVETVVENSCFFYLALHCLSVALWLLELTSFFNA
jgi:hypothetical protein